MSLGCRCHKLKLCHFDLNRGFDRRIKPQRIPLQLKHFNKGAKTMEAEKQESSIPFNEHSVEILLTTAKAEYDNEHNRTSIIDSKTNISLPIMTAFFLAFIQSNDYKTIFQLSTNNFIEWLLPATLFFSYTTALILGLLSVFFMTCVILTKKYKVLKTDDLYDEDLLKADPISFSIIVTKLYCVSTTHNKEQNDKRVKWYRLSWILMFITLILYIIYIIIKTNI